MEASDRKVLIEALAEHSFLDLTNPANSIKLRSFIKNGFDGLNDMSNPELRELAGILNLRTHPKLPPAMCAAVRAALDAPPSQRPSWRERFVRWLAA
jgi:hypothetical protein